MGEVIPQISCDQPTRQAHLGMIGSAQAGEQICIIESLRSSAINPLVVPRLGQRCTQECLLRDVDPMPPVN